MPCVSVRLEYVEYLEFGKGETNKEDGADGFVPFTRQSSYQPGSLECRGCMHSLKASGLAYLRVEFELVGCKLIVTCIRFQIEL